MTNEEIAPPCFHIIKHKKMMRLKIKKFQNRLETYTCSKRWFQENKILLALLLISFSASAVIARAQDAISSRSLKQRSWIAVTERFALSTNVTMHCRTVSRFLQSSESCLKLSSSWSTIGFRSSDRSYAGEEKSFFLLGEGKPNESKWWPFSFKRLKKSKQIIKIQLTPGRYLKTDQTFIISHLSIKRFSSLDHANFSAKNATTQIESTMLFYKRCINNKKYKKY